uniref:Uncharacterized protein n=1 Tax=Anguilla anguilla TaxID=7936 RepID=A0A0E9X9X8_ANGAN
MPKFHIWFLYLVFFSFLFFF